MIMFEEICKEVASDFVVVPVQRLSRGGSRGPLELEGAGGGRICADGVLEC